MSAIGNLSAQPVLPYKNSSLPVSQRVDDLLGRMTTEEKLGQLICLLGWDSYQREGDDIRLSDKFRQEMDQRHVGMYWATFRADPWTQKTLTNGLTPRLAARTANAMQRYAVEHTRLGIPLLLAEESPHGHMAIGTTVFPTGLALAASFDTALMERVGHVMASEIRAQGAHISYGPVIDLSRDPRWSRVEESMGEDPLLSGEMAAAIVHGTGGGDLSRPDATIATLKHFIAYGASEGGHNGGHAQVGLRELHACFLPPFRKAIDAGALSVMTAYNAVDGVPCTSNRSLLTDLLRNDWGFNGIVVSDLYSIDGLAGTHQVAASMTQAGELALKAGVDVDLGGNAFSKLKNAVSDGLLPMAEVDKVVRRVLTLKFRLGLFEQPYVDEQKAAGTVASDAHTVVALEAARKCVTLLKNHNGILPLKKDKRILVVGPNADNVYNQLGDYTAPQAEGHVMTVLDGICQCVGASRVEYVRGCAVRDTSWNEIDLAVAAARRADVVVAVVGGSSARDFRTSYEQTGAAETTGLSDMDCGEGFDRASLSLLGLQGRLLEALKSTGRPLVVIYIEGRPLLKNWAAEQADALLTAFYPGEAGGTAIAEVLFGDYNPAGRLPISVPREVGQLPVYYNQLQTSWHDYMDLSARPLYPFGFGLSYSSFDYGNLTVTSNDNDTLSVTFDITNTSDRDGEDVPQLYYRYRSAPVAQPMRQLCAFTRVFLKAGETRQLTLKVSKDDLSVVMPDGSRRIPTSPLLLMLGSSSQDICLHAEIP